ncbi:MAG: hypothetical protein KAH23_03870, partial [Kiritimatiellae bacterium]|nr:hypothetical protein [Kiritimatiellia bacterium]
MIPKFIVRMCKRGGYSKNFLQRLAVYSDDILDQLSARPRIWVHAVSVGEVYVAARFMREIRKSEPDSSFVLTTTTSTGYRIAEGEITENDVLLYFPSDFPIIVKRALNKIRPRALLLTESELWPNLIVEARRRRIPIILINGRISESSYRGYKMVRVFFRHALEAVDLFLMQTSLDKQRLTDLGADPDRIRIVGSAKYDVAEQSEQDGCRAKEVLAQIGLDENSMILVGGSTWPGEEDILLDI